LNMIDTHKGTHIAHLLHWFPPTLSLYLQQCQFVLFVLLVFELNWSGYLLVFKLFPPQIFWSSCKHQSDDNLLKIKRKNCVKMQIALMQSASISQFNH
jgi:hypothetical protein